MRGQNVMFFTLYVCMFVNNARTLHSQKWRRCIIQGEMVSAFVGRFRWGLQPFYVEETPFPRCENCCSVAQRLVPEWPRKFSKSEKMGEKFVCTTSTIYKRDKRKSLPQHFTPCIVDEYPYKNISLAHYRVPWQTFKFVPVVPKVHGRTNVCAHRKSIKPHNSEKCFGGFL